MPNQGATAVGDGFWPRLKRYLVGSYTPTLMHALFHLMGVLLAFIMASAWSARETELKDARTELAVLNALSQEADTLYKLATNWNLDAPPSPCSRAFYSEDSGPPFLRTSTARQTAGAGPKEKPLSPGQKPPGPGHKPPGPARTPSEPKEKPLEGEQKPPEFVFTTPIWQSVFTSDHALVIKKDRYTELRTTYTELAVAPKMTAVRCSAFLRRIRDNLKRLDEHLDADSKEAEAKLSTLDRALWSPRYDRHIKITLLVWISIMLSPAVIFAVGLVWKQQGAAYFATIPTALAYAQVVGILLLLITGVITFLTPSPSRHADVYYRLINLAGGAIATYVGFFGGGAKPMARVFGVVFTVAGVVVLIHPATMGNLPPVANRAYSFLYLVVGLWGMRAGFGRRIALVPSR